MKAVSEQGVRLNIRKSTLREWRQEFARHLREQGIKANATERAVRGDGRTHKLDGIYRAAQRGASTHMRERVEAVARDVRHGRLSCESGKSNLIGTRHEVRCGWQIVHDTLVKARQLELAAQVNQFVEQMPPPRTEREFIAESLLQHTRPSIDQLPTSRGSPPAR